ncbi:YcxB family protein [Neobacillus sp. DY30]|uniref:YcxB family protein n=1 Tax=Neobacillus sp. DY30 TaxID=3047871 RepID=UPI0024BF3648|nr:YcxB family protein [Neobacillus sp. DY30]WHY01416.1 YcxB family protein [Neobacillus sp. DY30]
MEIKYNLTEKDYLNFNLFHVKNSASATRSLNLQRYVTPLVYLIFAYIFSSIADIPFLYAAIPFLIVGILWAVFYSKYFYYTISRQTKKMIREGKNEGIIGEHTMNMTEEGIVDTNPNGETKVNWSGFIKLVEDESSLYLYNSAVSAYIIPKRDLANVEEIRQFIKSKLPNE